MSPDAGRPRRRRSATESLLSIVLALDALLVFFVTMAVFGLELLPPGVTFGGGAALILLFVVGARLLARSWGVWVCWALQGTLIALGAILTPMYFVGAGFVGIWVYCFITGTRLDRRNAALSTATEEPS